MHDLAPGPTVRQANRVYLLLLTLLLAGAVFLVPRLGIGGNLWVNELVYILLPPIFLAWRGKWAWREKFRIQPISWRIILLCLVTGATLWVFNSVLFTTLELWTNRALGTIPAAIGLTQITPVQAVLLLIGMVVLAPLCEELFFRGLLQRAYETYGSINGLVIAALLFGAMHILNGVNNLLPASLLGLALGFLAYRTGSIWASIAMHAGTNLMSRVGVILLPQLITGKQLPLWIYGLALATLLLGVWLLLQVGRMHPQAMLSPQVGRPRLLRSLAIWLSALLLLLVAGSELALRAGLIPSATAGVQPETVITAGKFTGDLPILIIDVQADDVGKSLSFRYELKVTSIDADLQLLTPRGEVAWEQNWQGMVLTVQTGDQVVDLDEAGEWKLQLQGTGEALELKASWRLLQP